MSKRQWLLQPVCISEKTASGYGNVATAVLPCPPDKSCCPLCGRQNVIPPRGKTQSDTGTLKPRPEDAPWYRHVSMIVDAHVGSGKDVQIAVECRSELCVFAAVVG